MPGPRARWAMLAVLCVSVFVVMMDVTVLNVALPALIADVRPSPLTQLWIVDIYSLLLGGLLILSGALGDRVGRKLMFVAGFVVFAVASVVAATAAHSWQVVIGRALCAIGAAMLMPPTLSMIRSIFTDDRERMRAIAIWSAVAGLGAAAGPLVGGVLVQSFGWRAAFWLNVPVAVVVIVAAVPLLPEYRAPHRGGGLDWFGAALSVFGIMALAWGIKHTATGGLTAADVAILLVGAVLLALFARRQLRSDDPLLDVRLFRRGPFTAAALATFVPQIVLGAMLLLLTLWLQSMHGYDPAQAGLRSLPIAVASLVGSLIAPQLLDRVEVRTTLGVSLLVVAGGLLYLGWAPQPISYGSIAAVQVTMGLGAGVVTTIASSMLVAAVPSERAGQAGAVSETSYDLGQGLGVALLGSIHGAVFAARMTDLPVSGPDADAARSVGGVVAVATRLGGDAGAALMAHARTAFDSALTTTAFIGAGLAVVATVLVVLLTPRGFTVSSAEPQRVSESDPRPAET
ncbi:MFS transporter [Nocardia sp. NPDC003482]